MEFETKFNIGDYIWSIERDNNGRLAPVEHTIVSFSIRYNPTNKSFFEELNKEYCHITYHLKSTTFNDVRDEPEIFTSWKVAQKECEKLNAQ